MIHLYNYDRSKTKYTLKFIGKTGNYKNDGSSITIHSSSGELEIQHTGDKSAKGTFHCENEVGQQVTNGKFDMSRE